MIAFLAVSYYIYVGIVLPKMNSKTAVFSDVANNSDKNETVEIMFFHVDWCPHCKNALPDWTAFSNEYGHSSPKVNGYVVKCTDWNCTDESDPKVKQIVAEYNISSYPTVIMLKDDVRYDFDAKLTKNALDQFLQKVTTMSE